MRYIFDSDAKRRRMLEIQRHFQKQRDAVPLKQWQVCLGVGNMGGVCAAETVASVVGGGYTSCVCVQRDAARCS